MILCTEYVELKRFPFTKSVKPSYRLPGYSTVPPLGSLKQPAGTAKVHARQAAGFGLVEVYSRLEDEFALIPDPGQPAFIRQVHPFRLYPLTIQRSSSERIQSCRGLPLKTSPRSTLLEPFLAPVLLGSSDSVVVQLPLQKPVVLIRSS
jgi:hypothetical protein